MKSARRSFSSSGSATRVPMTNIPATKGQAIMAPNGGLVFFLSSTSAALMDAANIIVFLNIFSTFSAKVSMFQKHGVYTLIVSTPGRSEESRKNYE